MHRRVLVLLAFSAAGVTAAQPPTVDGRFHFTTPQTAQSLQEALTIVRTVMDISGASADPDKAVLLLKGPAPMVPAAEWALGVLDQPGDGGMQDFLTVLRSVAGIQKVFGYTARQTLVLRATQPYMDRAEWLIQQLNEPSVGTHVFNTPGADDVTRVFYLPNATPQGLQFAMTAIRTDLQITKIYSTPNTLSVRGTADQVEGAAQLIAQKNGFQEVW